MYTRPLHCLLQAEVPSTRTRARRRSSQVASLDELRSQETPELATHPADENHQRHDQRHSDDDFVPSPTDEQRSHSTSGPDAEDPSDLVGGARGESDDPNMPAQHVMELFEGSIDKAACFADQADTATDMPDYNAAIGDDSIQYDLTGTPEKTPVAQVWTSMYGDTLSFRIPAPILSPCFIKVCDS